MVPKERIAENYQRIQDRIAQACVRSRREPREVRLVAVTKSEDVDSITALLELGHADLGESRAQDFIPKYEQVGAWFAERQRLNMPAAPPRWHMIGHLQRNKVKPILQKVCMIHSVDSLRLAEEINTNAARQGLNDKVQVLLEVNTSEEKEKYGLAVGAVLPLAEIVRELPNLEIVGLMTMAPQTNDKEISRFCFVRLRELFEELRGKNIGGPGFRHLSMGMSQDYDIAVEEGATLVRVGSALFA